MSVDPRDRLWEATFDTYYDAYYEELVADALISRWQWIDAITRVIVALTASGSAVAGWSLWNIPQFKFLWAIIAGASALFAIVHSTLGVSVILKEHGQTYALFSALRTELETFRHRMDIDPDFPLDKLSEDFLGFRKRLTEAIQSNRNDLLFTKRLANDIQDRLNLKLGDQIEN